MKPDIQMQDEGTGERYPIPKTGEFQDGLYRLPFLHSPPSSLPIYREWRVSEHAEGGVV